MVDDFYYDNSKIYSDEKHNKRGLWAWEQSAVNSFYKSCKSILVIGVGGGREALALGKLGYEVDGSECNPRLLQFAQKILSRDGENPNIQFTPRDQCPDTNKVYDGILLGYNTYMLIHGKSQRVAFLKKLCTIAKKQSPLLLSFYCRSGQGRRFKVIAITANIMRFLLRRDPVESGDDLYPYALTTGDSRSITLPYYVHYFTRDEIAAELKEGGFALAYYSTDDYPHAVGIVSNRERE